MLQVFDSAFCKAYCVFQANFKDAGNYDLIVSSSVFQQISLTFQIIVESNKADPSTTNPSNSIPLVALIVPVVILIIIIFLLTIILFFVYRRINNVGKYLYFDVDDCFKAENFFVVIRTFVKYRMTASHMFTAMFCCQN